MRFEEALIAMMKGAKIKRSIYETPIAYSSKRNKICFWVDETIGKDGTNYGCEVDFANADRVANDWAVVEDIDEMVLPINKIEEMLKKAPITFESEEKPMESAERIEITFKSGETISYGKGEWDDYAFDGKAVIVKKNGAWVGIYNFDNVFCVELK